MIAKIAIYVIVYTFFLLIFMIIRKRMYIKSLKNRVNDMYNIGDINNETKKRF